MTESGQGLEPAMLRGLDARLRLHGGTVIGIGTAKIVIAGETDQMSIGMTPDGEIVIVTGTGTTTGMRMRDGGETMDGAMKEWLPAETATVKPVTGPATGMTTIDDGVSSNPTVAANDCHLETEIANAAETTEMKGTPNLGKTVETVTENGRKTPSQPGWTTTYRVTPSVAVF